MASRAATTAPTTQNFDPDKAPHSPFELSAAASQGESVSTLLRSMQAEITADHETPVIASELPVLTTEINARLDETSKLLDANPSLQLLETEERDWTGLHKNLDGWSQQLQRQLERIGNQRTLTDHQAKQWEAARQRADYFLPNPRVTQVMETALASIDPTLARIKITDGMLADRGLYLFKLRQRVDEQNAHVQDALESIREARAEAFNRLFARNAEPIWNGLGPSSSGSVIQQSRDSLYQQLQAVWAYIQRRSENVAGQLFLLIALTTAIFYSRGKVRGWVEQDPGFKPAMALFVAPLATAIVLTILLSGWIYPQAPRFFSAIMGAAALIPTVVILRRLIDRRLFSLLDSLVAFYFIDELRVITAAIPAVVRVLFLIEMLGAAGLLASFIHSIRGQSARNRIWRIVHVVGWLVLVTCLIAFAADALGYVSIGSLLGDAALQSAYLAVVLYACVSIAIGLVVIALRTRPLIRLGMVCRHQTMMLRRITWAIRWLAAAAWWLGLLSALSVTSLLFDALNRVLSATATIAGFNLSLGNLLKFTFVIWASFIVSRFLRFVLDEDVYDRFPMPSGLAYAISRMLHYAIVLIGFYIAVHAMHYDLTQFTILVGAFGVGLGFGMQNILNNFFSGIILLFERPVKVGDVIQMDDITGVVAHIGIRASIIKTRDSSEIIIPNGNLISNKVTNWTLSNDQRGICMPVTIAANVEPQRVMDLLKKVAAAHPKIVTNPPPQVFLTTFSGDGFHYELHAWTDEAEHWVQIRSDLAVSLNAELTRENIPIR
jgi:small-conductance mechanosensitive channel